MGEYSEAVQEADL